MHEPTLLTCCGASSRAGPSTLARGGGGHVWCFGGGWTFEASLVNFSAVRRFVSAEAVLRTVRIIQCIASVFSVSELFPLSL